jgi:hypothetical protein
LGTVKIYQAIVCLVQFGPNSVRDWIFDYAGERDGSRRSPFAPEVQGWWLVTLFVFVNSIFAGSSRYPIVMVQTIQDWECNDSWLSLVPPELTDSLPESTAQSLGAAGAG